MLDAFEVDWSERLNCEEDQHDSSELSLKRFIQLSTINHYAIRNFDYYHLTHSLTLIFVNSMPLTLSDLFIA